MDPYPPALNSRRFYTCPVLPTGRGPWTQCRLCTSSSGLRGLIFKVRLSRFGYTLVVKVVEKANVALLHHEMHVYDGMLGDQGRCVPFVWELIRPLYSICRLDPNYTKFVPILEESPAGTTVVVAAALGPPLLRSVKGRNRTLAWDATIGVRLAESLN